MRVFLSVVVVGLAALVTAGTLRAAGEPPAWAYAIPPAPPAGVGGAPAAPAAPDPTPRTLPGSTLSMVRQMYDMQVGARKGEWTALMKPVVDKLTDEDFVSIAAYVSSRMP